MHTTDMRLLSNTQAYTQCTCPAFPQIPQVHTQTHMCPDTSEHPHRACTSPQGQWPLACIDLLKLVHWTRAPELTETQPLHPQLLCYLLLPKTSSGTSPSALECHPPEVAGGWGHDDSLLWGHLYSTYPMARTPSSSHIPPIRKLGISLSCPSHFLTGWWPWADNWQVRIVCGWSPLVGRQGRG